VGGSLPLSKQAVAIFTSLFNKPSLLKILDPPLGILLQNSDTFPRLHYAVDCRAWYPLSNNSVAYKRYNLRLLHQSFVYLYLNNVHYNCVSTSSVLLSLLNTMHTTRRQLVAFRLTLNIVFVKQNVHRI